jgi:hypothetical protein
MKKLDFKLSPCSEYCNSVTAYEDGTECSETSANKFRRRGIAQKKEYTEKAVSASILAEEWML